jgi:hypothetical protein
VKATPSGGSNVPLTPAAALKLYMQHMTLYEQGEILDYPQVCLTAYLFLLPGLVLSLSLSSLLSLSLSYCLSICLLVLLSLSVSLSLSLSVLLSVYLSYCLFLLLLPSNMPFHASLDLFKSLSHTHSVCTCMFMSICTMWGESKQVDA